MNNEVRDVIIVEQLPVITEQLRAIKADIEQVTKNALALECTDDTVKIVKDERAKLNKLFAEFETRRKEVKTQILAPYEAFERVYKECITDPLSMADRELKQKINSVEDELKATKAAELKRYYDEYRTSIGLSEHDAPFECANISVTLSASLKSLKEKAKEHLDRIQRDLAMIATLDNHAEVLAEYRLAGNVTDAIAAVNARKRAIEEERRRTVERQLDAEQEAEVVERVDEAIEEFAPPEVIEPVEETPPEEEEPQEEIYEAAFTVYGTIAQLKALKEFMISEGIKFESAKNK